MDSIWKPERSDLTGVLKIETLSSADIIRLRADGFDVPDVCNGCGERLKGEAHRGCDDARVNAGRGCTRRRPGWSRGRSRACPGAAHAREAGEHG